MAVLSLSYKIRAAQQAQFRYPARPPSPGRPLFLDLMKMGRDHKVLTYVPSNRVISSPFLHKTFYFTKLCEGTPYFFSDRKFVKNCFRC
jgi:hypothetical protein